MLTYLINVTGDLFAGSLIIGVSLAFVDRFLGEKGRVIARSGFIIGLIIAAVRAYITNTRRLVGGWRVGAYGLLISLAVFAVLIIVLIVLFRKVKNVQEDERRTSAPQLVIAIAAAALIASYLYIDLPNVYAYPFKFDTNGNGLLSTDFLFRLGGYLLGILVCVLSAVVAYKLVTLAAKKGYSRMLFVSFVVLNIMYGVYNFARLMLVLTPRKIVDSPALFDFAAASSNHAEWYTYGAFIVLLILAVILWIKSFTVKEPYSTKAEHRKQRAMWRNAKRYSVVLLACFVFSILCATWFVKLNTVEIREAPVEDPVIVKDGTGNDSELLVPIEMVSDGHLHRFGYTTSDGNPTRFIVVLKQENTNNYGIGLDACEICGEAGYYENNDGQVVCKKCGVVMNKTTIGMKGGCNPIIIDYDIDESNIIVPVSEMVRTQSNFKK